ncbi:EAL domain-containing protein [Methylomonas sp. SURF-2]|uniref:EAL domain-containing protein n=1 Tax=Methylomonas subterranea TaxID=2952225 RepID=A0ABT1TKP8_9GAMM|nr:EAL domain-containing protein [Methylomonas sp. SURF-2]MCQ8106049.1 EAL domain-containing protein [Methylomonas sp. SURF-2]
MVDTLNRLSLILDTIADGILVVDRQGLVLYANQAAEQLFERPTIVGQSLAIPITGDTSAPQDINLIRPSGFAWAEMRAAPLVWEGKPAYAIGLRDISARKAAEMALRQSETLFQTLARLAPVGIFKTDALGKCEYVNQRWCDISGLDSAAALGDGWGESIAVEDRRRVVEEWQLAVRTQTPFYSQYRFQHKNGPLRWVVGRAEAEYDDGNRLLGYIGTVTDISEIKRNEDYLRLAAAVFETTREGMIISDANCIIQKVNRAFSEITGYSQSEVLGKSTKLLHSGRHPEEFYAAMWREINQTGYWQGEIWNRRKNGELYPELLSISTVKNAADEIRNYVGVFADISKLKASEQELEFLAHHDPLTKLPNRMLLMSRLQHSISQAQRQQTQLAIVMLDLDRFKDVNDSFGHLAGDDLLQSVAERLSARLRASDTVCRLGGDEFVVLLEDLAQPETAARIATDIIASVNEPWQLSNGNEVRVGASIGIALYPEHGDTPVELLQHADTALYQAKNEGRNCFKYFSEALTLAARERIGIEFRLRRAMDNQEFRLFYQPQLKIGSGEIVGVEALIRWQTDSGELIPPLKFIPIAEETGLIAGLGRWVLQEACRQGKAWLDAGLPPLRIAVNLSPTQFMHGDICAIVASTLAETGFPANYLELELTESALMKREKEAIDILNRLHELGVHLAIDDFGTGYSSLAYLKAFPLDVLKIDKSFIDDIPMQNDDMEITATIIAMAKTLRMQVIAEGVETPAQMAFLRSRNCDFYQGYIASKPLPAAEFEIFLHQHKPEPNA